ncbi:MAG TPA: hypothetical protein VFO16_01395 [Pseudonocardiaceae bacterium]|nr:hypothetical protein [Pseudonocardiaceae bacterium]
MSVRGVVAALLTMMLSAAVISVVPDAPPTTAASVAGMPLDSALTVSGTGAFANLKVSA